MKRGQYTRAPSPTPTAFSGISNYKTDSYRPLKDKNAPALPTLDPRIVAKTHFDELSRYLSAYLARASPNSRSTARQKLTRLTRQQFQELSTDVYDELMRRKKNTSENEVPFLPVRDDFHPKRNQARQKLATLPTSRFEDLSSDVYYELARRYPEFKEEVDGGMNSAGSAYDDIPSPDFPAQSRTTLSKSASTRGGRMSDDRGFDGTFGGSPSSGRRPSEDNRRRRPVEEDYGPGRSSEDAYGGVAKYEDTPAISLSSSRRKPSQDTGRRSEDREHTRRPSAATGTTSESATSGANPQIASVTSGVVIPNKSTIAEEEIEVPYAREVRESSGTALDDRDRVKGEIDADSEGGFESAGEFASPRSALGGLSGLTARLRVVEADDDETGPSGARSGEDYYDKMSLGRTSAASDRSVGAPPGASQAKGIGGRTSTGGEDNERLRRDYEYKIATMQNRIAGLERDVGNVGESDRKWREAEDRVRTLEDELNGLRQRAEEQGNIMRGLQKELDELRDSRSKEKEREARRARDDEAEIQILRERCERLEEERVQVKSTGNAELVDQLRSDMEALIKELSDLSRRNDELIIAKEADNTVIRDLDAQLKDYKRKYEQAKTELRNIKATSQLFLQAPRMDDQLPVSNNGGITDVHITSFLSAVDALLTAGRSNSPTRVLSPMKAVVNSVSAILDDLTVYEQTVRPEMLDVSSDSLRTLRERAEATLSNLVTASRTHATGAGMSPVSLLDAAASHVSATITEIGKIVRIRQTRGGRENENNSTIRNHPPGGRPVDEEIPTRHQRQPSAASKRNDTTASPYGQGYTTDSPLGRMSREDAHPVSNESSSPDTSSPPPLFDKLHLAGGIGPASDDSAIADGSEDAWSELKPYLDAQTETIVYAIQSVLSGVRSPTPTPKLNENLTQIITIVSSIVAVCNDNLPPQSARLGNDILRELRDHANKLSEVQALPEVTKESRQVMAKSSFAIANAMKGLMKL